MVHALEGGYGTARLHPLIDWDAIGDPRIVCGFSDLTALHLFVAAHAGWVSFYGPSFLRFTRTQGRLPADQGDRGVVPPGASGPSRSAGSSRIPRTPTC